LRGHEEHRSPTIRVARIVTVTATAALAAGALAGATPATSQPPAGAQSIPGGLDHFKCYTVAKQPAALRAATLTDQFGTRNSRVLEVRQLCNPVRKRHGKTITPIDHPRAHLVCRRTTDDLPTAVRDVRLRNQFGVIDTRTTTAQTLCLPSLKRIVKGKPVAPTGPNPELVLDHFRCYGVQPRPVSLSVRLKDQFGVSPAKVIRLVRLCNPVRKSYQGKAAKIKRPSAHLACYTIKDKLPFKPRKVVVRNQFGVAQLVAQKVETLCLPTREQVIGTPDVWAMDNAADDGTEPSSQPSWISPDIRVRTTQGDGMNEDPELGQTNFIYVTVRNQGSAPVTDVHVVVWVADANVGGWWRPDWTQINAIPVTVASIDANDSTVVEIPWNPPGLGHYCLLATLESADDPLGPDLPWDEVTAYDAVVQLNVTIVDHLLNGPQDVSLLVRNPRPEARRVNVGFAVPAEERADPFLDHGQVVADLTAFRDEFATGAVKLRGMRQTDGSKYRIVDPANAAILGLALKGRETRAVGLRFEAAGLEPGKTYHFDVTEEYADGARDADRVVGGIRYDVSG
jgi:hypothetical protein